MSDFFDRAGWAALSSRHTLRATYYITRMILDERIPGDLVECGVFAGAQAAAMAQACMDAGEFRRVHMFDSFAGIPAPGPEDAGWVHPAGASACPRWQVEQYMRDWGIDSRLLVYHEGLFADTVPGCGIEQIALLRLDGDLYESTRVCMEHLHPKLAPGGWCIVDDYHLDGCRKAVHEFVHPGPVYWRV